MHSRQIIVADIFILTAHLFYETHPTRNHNKEVRHNPSLKQLTYLSANKNPLQNVNGELKYIEEE